MGQTHKARRLPDAAGGRAAGGLALRLHLKAFAADQSGATAIEYGLIITLIFLAIVTGVSLFANNTVVMFGRIATAVSGTR